MNEFKFKKTDDQNTMLKNAKNGIAMWKELRPGSGMLFFTTPELDYKSMPADARVEFLYMPTYTFAANLINCKMILGDLFSNDKELEDSFKGVLLACTGKGMTGHGYEEFDGLVDAMDISLTAPLKKFLKLYGKDYPEFTEYAKATVKTLRGIAEGKLHSAWGKSEDLIKKAKELIAIWENA